MAANLQDSVADHTSVGADSERRAIGLLLTRESFERANKTRLRLGIPRDLLPAREQLRNSNAPWQHQAFRNYKPLLPELARNMQAVQLNSGCSVGCHFCGIQAKKGAGEALPIEDLLRFAGRFSAELRQHNPFLYYSSDPYDYRGVNPADQQPIGYNELHRAWSLLIGKRPYVSTAVPKGHEQEVLSAAHAGEVSRISLHYQNRGRLKKVAPQFTDRENRSRDFPGVHFFEVPIKPWLNPKTASLDTYKVPTPQNDSQISGIGCFDGVQLSPEGFFNVVQGVTSPHSQMGQMIVQIDPEKATQPLPREPLPILELLARGVVQRRWRTLDGNYGELLTPLQRLFSRDSAPYFMGNIVSMKNACDEEGYFALNFLDGSATPCNKEEYEMTSKSSVVLLILQSQRALFFFPEAIVGNQDIKQFIAIDCTKLSSRFDKPYIATLQSEIITTLRYLNQIQNRDILEEPSTVRGRKMWRVLMHSARSAGLIAFQKPVLDLHRTLMNE